MTLQDAQNEDLSADYTTEHRLSTFSQSFRHHHHRQHSTATSDNATILLRDGEAELRRHDAEIYRLKASLLAAEIRRDRLKHSLEACRSLYGAVHRLPTEVLTEIFLFSSPVSHLNLQSPMKPRMMELSEVCGRWRDVCISSPSLWASLNISAKNVSESIDGEYKFYRLVKLFIDRSQEHPLSVSFHFDPTIPTSLLFDETLKLIVRQSYRWEALGLNAPGILPSAFLAAKGNLPILRNLGVQCDNTNEAMNVLGPFPSVTNLFFDLRAPLEQNLPPFSELRELRLWVKGTYDPGLVSQLLSGWKTFEKLSLTIWKEPSPGAVVTGDVIVLKLKTFILFLVSGKHNSSDIVLNTLSLPHLSSLELRSSAAVQTGQSAVWEEASLFSLLSRSKCNSTLTSLSLITTPLTDLQVIEILRLSPALTTLQIVEKGTQATKEQNTNRIMTPLLHNHMYINDGLTSLSKFRGIAGSSSIRLVPRLTELRVSVHSNRLDISSFVAAIVSRWMPDPLLGVENMKFVEIRLLDRPESVPERLDELRYFSDAGMRVVFDGLDGGQ